MSRYIDADALIEELQRCSRETWSKDINRAWWAQAVKIKDNIVRCIDRQPTADVVEVVRCKDCIHARNMPLGLCYLHTEPYDNAKGYKGDAVCVEADDFCSCGERSEK